MNKCHSTNTHNFFSGNLNKMHLDALLIVLFSMTTVLLQILMLNSSCFLAGCGSKLKETMSTCEIGT